MQFNTYEFVLVFLPIFLILYFVANQFRPSLGRWTIIIAGLIFYYDAGRVSFCVFLLSAAMNLAMALFIWHFQRFQRVILALTISVNVGLLLYYKYMSYIVENVLADEVSDASAVVQNFVMPLGISFFTFQQIMYVVNVYRGEIPKVDVIDYLAYITFFPKLIMGPLVEPTSLIDQINDSARKKIDWDNMAGGLKLFSFGLFKKMVLADTFTKGVAWGFGNIDTATSADLMLVMLFYTFEIYFDFSGYTDMAVGISKMVNIELPMNFNSPYKATSIRDFWKRWHISLTRFFTEYVYYPLGGSRKGNIRTYLNIMVVFLVSGLWHGANWTFLLWGGVTEPSRSWRGCLTSIMGDSLSL